jgi:hypothetical protein
MKLFTGCLAASLVLFAAGAQAQRLAPVSDFGGPYAAMPDAPGAQYGSGPRLLPPEEVYTVVRENGFSPLGIPRQRGFVYAIEVIDRSGESGRLVVDARDGRIIRFRPGYRVGTNFGEDPPPVVYGQPGPLPPSTPIKGEPRPPRSIPNVASRTVPVPRASPLATKVEAKPEASKPEASKHEALPQQPQQSAATQSKPAETPAAPPAVTTGQAPPPKPVAEIAPTKDLPKVQGLE